MIPEYAITVAINVCIWIILSISLNIVAGYAGQPNLGQAAFMGIGAYTLAILTTRHGFSFWTAIIFSILIVALIGSLLGLVSLRLREDFLAFTTIGLNFIIVSIFLYSDFFGASFGIGGIRPPYLFGFKFTKPIFLIMLAIIAALCAIGSKALEKSWAGMALMTIRDDEVAAQTIGINIYKFKVLVFTISTGLAGLAGGLYASYMGFIYPLNFDFSASIIIMAMVIVGGLGTVEGAIVGATLLEVAPELLRPLLEYRMLFYGMLIVLVMIYLPSGLLGHGSPLVNFIREAMFGLSKRE
jgi:branched-chain amino acid transport system permease protein